MSNHENNRDTIPGQEKEFSIIINGVEHDFNEKGISYENVVQLADIPSVGSNSMVTVAYERGENGKSGSLIAGDEVKVKEGMFFHVEFTNRS
ncbi:multiubiquitin domain-containing protein [Sulfurimonas sp. HSL3-7]|uniref:multiubiquitin domain-containing protein n=1 Tax=Sulfonitrofixus jiaomeiensis TaxID=3131938 RepID=UPI0031F75D51